MWPTSEEDKRKLAVLERKFLRHIFSPKKIIKQVNMKKVTYTFCFFPGVYRTNMNKVEQKKKKLKL
jgi:hypothetical protein